MAVLCLMIVCLLSACLSPGNDYTGDAYKIKYELDNVAGHFIATPSAAKPGDTVELKTEVLIDTDIHVYLDGQEIDKSHSDSDYWGYSFCMPAKDVLVTASFYTKDEIIGETDETIETPNPSPWTTGAQLPSKCRDEEYWKSVNFAIMGDSITELDNYQHKINDALHFADMYVDGKSGTMISGTGKGSFSNKKRTSAVPKNSDVIFVFGGTNDYHYDKKLGEKTDDTVSTFYGALNVLIDALKGRCPNALIIFATPLQRTLMPISGNIENNLGFVLEDYVRAIIEVCDEKGIVVMDLYDNSAITAECADRYTFDGLHPNEEGFAVLADEIVAFLTDTGCMFPAEQKK